MSVTIVCNCDGSRCARVGLCLAPQSERRWFQVYDGQHAFDVLSWSPVAVTSSQQSRGNDIEGVVVPDDGDDAAASGGVGESKSEEVDAKAEGTTALSCCHVALLLCYCSRGQRRWCCLLRRSIYGAVD